MDKATEKRDKLIYRIVVERYKLEWQRTNDIDTKASSITGFAGIIATLHTGLMGLLSLQLNPDNISFYLSFIPLILLGFSLFLALYAYWIKTWEAINPISLIERYKDQEHDIVLRRVASTISDMAMNNCEVNNRKVKLVKWALVILALGVVSIFAVPILTI